MTRRDTVHQIVDQLADEELGTAEALLGALRKGLSAEELEDALDGYEIRRLRHEQRGDELESLDDFGKRRGLE